MNKPATDATLRWCRHIGCAMVTAQSGREGSSHVTRNGAAAALALNGSLLMLAGRFAGAAIPAAPYPRLMLAAHSAGFTLSGVITMLAALLLQSSLCPVSPRPASLIAWGHVLLWPLCLSEVAAAFWDTNQTLRIAGAEAGAPGGAPWQETLVAVCHAIPALALMVAWMFIVWGTWTAFKHQGRNPA